MIFSFKRFLAFGVVFFMTIFSISAQENSYSNDQLLGKWILKSAQFNGQEISLAGVKSQVSFEFLDDGMVTLVTFDGKEESGAYEVEKNKLIDINLAERSGADIISLTENALVLSMEEDKNRVLMTFQLEEK